MTFKNKDFLEIEFTGKMLDGTIFDSNIPAVLKEIGSKQVGKPFTFALGEGMFLTGVEEFLIGKDVGEYTIELTPEKAFGIRNPKLVQLMPASVFKNHNTRPIPGMVFNFDGKMGKVLSANGGRIRVDFNNPMSGKDVIYTVNVKNQVTDDKEKVKALNEFLFRQEFEFDIKDKKVIMKANEQMKRVLEMFKEKYKDILGLELEVEEVADKKEVPKKE